MCRKQHWGQPFLLRSVPFKQPETATHLALPTLVSLDLALERALNSFQVGLSTHLHIQDRTDRSLRISEKDQKITPKLETSL